MELSDLIFGWEHIHLSHILGGAIGLVFIYWLFFIKLDGTDHRIAKAFDSGCWISCKNPVCKRLMRLMRDDDYMIFSKTCHDECLYSAWEVSHVLLHIAIGYYLNLWVSMSLSIVFEIWEHVSHNCGSVVDVVWNTAGFLAGVGLRVW